MHAADGVPHQSLLAQVKTFIYIKRLAVRWELTAELTVCHPKGREPVGCQ